MQLSLATTNLQERRRNTKVDDHVATEVLPLTKSLVGVVTAKLLNVRSSPEIVDGNVVSLLIGGTELLVTPENDDFYKILTKAGDEGYCMKKFIEMRGDHVNG